MESITRPYQGLFIDFGFSGCVSYDKDGKVEPSSRVHVQGINGESAWILICDAQTKMLHGNCQTNKASPVKYLKSFLQEYSPTCDNNFVMLDQGGKLYCNLEIRNLFCKFGYEVQCTGADASNQNGPVERTVLFQIVFGFYFLDLDYPLVSGLIRLIMSYKFEMLCHIVDKIDLLSKVRITERTISRI